MDNALLPIMILGLLIYVRVSMAGLNQSGARQAVRLGRLERKVDAIVKHLGVSVVDEVDPKVLELVIAGKKIEAIKLYREQTKVGLKEAKDYVESL